MRRPFQFLLIRLFTARGAVLAGALALGGFALSCAELEKPRSDAFFAEPTSPRKQELRWSNGKLPRTLDPSTTFSAPETDIVRAIYEGLTELDGRTLQARPAVAERWTATEDKREWTFEIRGEAKWTNGEPVTADDFVRSWERAAKISGRSPQSEALFANIIGLGAEPAETRRPGKKPVDGTETPTANGTPLSDTGSAAENDPGTTIKGIEAAGPRTLFVRLREPDSDLPMLLAHPVFRPVHRGSEVTDLTGRSVASVTNGPFRIDQMTDTGLLLQRSENYWNRDAVRLDSVQFAPMESTEKALEAYRAGKLDVITNASFSPVLLKLLSPYEDFRRTTFAAINLYEFSPARPPFDDRRVRQALAMAIERDRLSEGELEGTTVSAPTFMPFASSAAGIVEDRTRAADLLDEAGYPNGEGFPVVRLVVNRNDTQLRIARLVTGMWREKLNIESEIIQKENSEMDEARRKGDFDLIRRGVVLPTPNELANIRAVFGPPSGGNAAEPAIPDTSPRSGRNDTSVDELSIIASREEALIIDLTTHEQALYELRAIPLYFPSSYSLVKPFVVGFETNALDAMTLGGVSIDENWPAGR